MFTNFRLFNHNIIITILSVSFIHSLNALFLNIQACHEWVNVLERFLP